MKLSKEVKVGLLATVALTTVYLGFNFLKGKAVFSSNNSYYTIYTNCRGLAVSSLVLLNGVPVGKVRQLQILPNKEHSVLVTFETKKEIKLTDASKARLISTSLLGDKVIDLHIKEGNLLKNYDTVQGQSELSLEAELFEGTLPALKDVQKVSLLASQFVANLIENTDKINSIFANLEDTTQTLKQSINNNQQEFHILSQNMTKISRALADSNSGVGPLLEKLNQLMHGVKGKEVKEIATKLDNILGSIGRVLDKIEQGNNSLTQLLDDDDFYNNLNQTLGNLDKLLIDFKAHPWRYVNFSVFGKTQGHKPVQQEP